jgi:hypothetical protein
MAVDQCERPAHLFRDVLQERDYRPCRLRLGAWPFNQPLEFLHRVGQEIIIHAYPRTIGHGEIYRRHMGTPAL